ncbi:hypothetical protein [Plantactinospora sp. WMMB782]|uniref:hypothetical protein n=1 Tax=Plantactinospora sp. WMMB782 TaxID=3404121 RepID=UPI003B952737
MTVCRGCCCGSSRKHPEVDHDGQVRRLRTALDGRHRVRTSDCLDVCERSNVVVVNPSPTGRRAGGVPVWLGEVLDDTTLTAVTEWISAGGPGIVGQPAALTGRIMRPRHSRSI